MTNPKTALIEHICTLLTCDTSDPNTRRTIALAHHRDLRQTLQRTPVSAPTPHQVANHQRRQASKNPDQLKALRNLYKELGPEGLTKAAKTISNLNTQERTQFLTTNPDKTPSGSGTCTVPEPLLLPPGRPTAGSGAPRRPGASGSRTDGRSRSKSRQPK